MKKFLGVLAALFLGASVYAVDIDWTNPSEVTDATRYNKLLRVYNADNVAHENGDVVVWQYDAVYGLEITTTTSANNALVAGVVYPNTIAAGGFGTIMVYGYHPAVTIGVANSSGAVLITSTTGEATGVFDVSVSTEAYSVGIALESTTSSTTVKALINAL